MTTEIFQSATRTRGDLAGVLEHDGETTYFYLYDPRGPGGGKILGALQLRLFDISIVAEDVSVRWDGPEEWVGVFVKDKLYAVFDAVTRSSYGEAGSPLPARVVARFITS